MRFPAFWPFLGLVPLFVSIHAYGDEGDVINLNATASSLRDSNLFRLASDVSPESVGLKTRSDTINTLGAGINFNKRFSLQQVIGNLNVVDTRYRTYDFLDFKSVNYDAKWLWGIGLRLSGDLAIDRSQALNTFTDYTNYLQRNVRVTENQRFNLDYWFHSNWHLVGGVSRTTLTNEKEFLAEGDYESRGYNLGFRYKPRSGNTLTWRYKRAEGEYNKRQLDPVGQFDTGFTQSGHEFNLRWQLTGKGLINGRLEYVDRQHDHFGDRDYSGWVGNIDYVYAATGKTSYSAGYRRARESFQQRFTSFYLADALNFSTQWAATGKLSTSARISYGKRKYLGAIAALPSGMHTREDKTARISFDVLYQPALWLDLRAGVGAEKRKSTADGLDYVDRTAMVSADAHF